MKKQQSVDKTVHSITSLEFSIISHNLAKQEENVDVVQISIIFLSTQTLQPDR